MYKRPERLSAVLVLLLAFAGRGFALPDDREKPIHISATEALRDENKGFTEYRGNVTLDQGSLHIEADALTVYHTGKDAQKITALGKPATLRQQPEIDKAEITASANRIEYFRNDARVELRENASIEQDGAIVTGDRIDYLIDEKLVKADSNRDRDDSRVQVVIPAQSLQGENGAADSPPAGEANPQSDAEADAEVQTEAGAASDAEAGDGDSGGQ